MPNAECYCYLSLDSSRCAAHWHQILASKLVHCFRESKSRQRGWLAILRMASEIFERWSRLEWSRWKANKDRRQRVGEEKNICEHVIGSTSEKNVIGSIKTNLRALTCWRCDRLGNGEGKVKRRENWKRAMAWGESERKNNKAVKDQRLGGRGSGSRNVERERARAGRKAEGSGKSGDSWSWYHGDKMVIINILMVNWNYDNPRETQAWCWHCWRMEHPSLLTRWDDDDGDDDDEDDTLKIINLYWKLYLYLNMPYCQPLCTLFCSMCCMLLFNYRAKWNGVASDDRCATYSWCCELRQMCYVDVALCVRGWLMRYILLNGRTPARGGTQATWTTPPIYIRYLQRSALASYKEVHQLLNDAHCVRCKSHEDMIFISQVTQEKVKGRYMSTLIMGDGQALLSLDFNKSEALSYSLTWKGLGSFKAGNHPSSENQRALSKRSARNRAQKNWGQEITIGRPRNPFGNFGKSIWALVLTGGPLWPLWVGAGRLKGGFQCRK